MTKRRPVMWLKAKATVRARRPAEPLTIGDWLVEQAVRRRRQAPSGRPQFKVSALPLVSPGRQKYQWSPAPALKF